MFRTGFLCFTLKSVEYSRYLPLTPHQCKGGRGQVWPAHPGAAHTRGQPQAGAGGMTADGGGEAHRCHKLSDMGMV